MIPAQSYDFARQEDCEYDFDHDGYIDHWSGGDDCDDVRDFINPGAIEECGGPTCSDNFDNDCDGFVDEGCSSCAGSVAASTIGANPVYGASDLGKHLAYFLLPLGAVIGPMVWRRKR